MEQYSPYKQLALALIPEIKNYEVIEVREEPSDLVIVLEPQLETSVCPHCGTESSKVKSRRIQRYQHTPYNGTSIILEVNVRQFECSNPDCNHKNFTEPIPFASEYQRYAANFVRKIIDAIFENDLNATVRIMDKRGAEIDHSSLQRLMRRLEKPEDIVDVEINDVSLRTYLEEKFNS